VRRERGFETHLPHQQHRRYSMDKWGDNGYYEDRDEDTVSVHFAYPYERRAVKWCIEEQNEQNVS